MKKNTTIILQKDLLNVGSKGIVTNVTRGYAVNYLIPKKIAVLAKPGHIKHMNMIQELEVQKQSNNLNRATSIKNQIEKIKKIVLYRTIGKDQLIFGNITEKDILKMLHKQSNISLNKHQIEIPNIKHVGIYTIKIVVFQTIKFDFKLQIMPKDI